MWLENVVKADDHWTLTLKAFDTFHAALLSSLKYEHERMALINFIIPVKNIKSEKSFKVHDIVPKLVY